MIAELKRLIKKLRKKSHNAYLSTWNSNSNYEVGTPAIAMNSIGYTSFTSNDFEKRTENVDNREVKKPVEVVESIVTPVPIIDITDIDRQIKIVQRRIDVLKEQNVNLGDEIVAMGFLKARKLYKKYGNLFQWKVTTDEKIQQLLRTYKLQRVNFASYYKNVPNEALDEIEKFTKGFDLVSDEKPVLELICDLGGPETKKDPILLARSPFGRWYYILGAWDKEVEIVDDLVYKGK